MAQSIAGRVFREPVRAVKAVVGSDEDRGVQEAEQFGDVDRAAGGIRLFVERFRGKAHSHEVDLVWTRHAAVFRIHDDETAEVGRRPHKVVVEHLIGIEPNAVVRIRFGRLDEFRFAPVEEIRRRRQERAALLREQVDAAELREALPSFRHGDGHPSAVFEDGCRIEIEKGSDLTDTAEYAAVTGRGFGDREEGNAERKPSGDRFLDNRRPLVDRLGCRPDSGALSIRSLLSRRRYFLGRRVSGIVLLQCDRRFRFLVSDFWAAVASR